MIVSDYFMPHANIDFLLWKLRSTPATEKIPVFAMTGYGLDAVTNERLINHPFGRRWVDRVFKKPLDVDELFLAIQKRCALQYNSTRDPR